MRGSIASVHFVDFHSDARHAICGWVPPPDYAGTTVFMTALSCPACARAIQTRVEALRPPAEDRASTTASR